MTSFLGYKEIFPNSLFSETLPSTLLWFYHCHSVSQSPVQCSITKHIHWNMFLNVKQWPTQISSSVYSRGVQNVLSSSPINPNSFKSITGVLTSCTNRTAPFIPPTSLCSILCCSMREHSDATVINYLCKMIMHMINQTQHAYTML